MKQSQPQPKIEIFLVPDSDDCTNISALCAGTTDEVIVDADNCSLFISCCLGWDRISFALGYLQSVEMHHEDWASWLTTHGEIKY